MIEVNAVENRLIRFDEALEITPQAEVFLESAVAIGSEFLASGGPVTRLETQLVKAGSYWGYETNVQATPSGLMISCYSQGENKTYSRMKRINDFTVNLGHLRCIDKLLGDFAEAKIGLRKSLTRLQKIKSIKQKNAFWKNPICLFGIGTGAAILSNAPIGYSLIAGALTASVDLGVGSLTKLFDGRKIFNDFICCLITFLLAVFGAHFFGIPAAFLCVGTLAHIVPGLQMTTAISEIVDQNYLSGTIRLLKALYTFLAMALAYFLVGDFVSNMGWDLQSDFDLSQGQQIHGLWFKLLGTAMVIYGFSIAFHAHKKSLLRILFCGLTGSLTFFAMTTQSYLVLSSFTAAFTIGFVSFYLSRRYKHPSQIYSVPSILSLVPGMLAFSSFGYGRGAEANSGLALDFAVQAMLISLAIVLGLAAGRIPLGISQK